MFKMTPNILRNFFTKRATRRYPYVERSPFEGTRGELCIEIEKCTFCGVCAVKCPSQCIRVNMPCRGCFGPPEGVEDQGASMLSAVASRFSGRSEEDVAEMVEEVADPAGTFYRFGMSVSMLKRKAQNHERVSGQ